jgi:hypothetical protein
MIIKGAKRENKYVNDIKLNCEVGGGGIYSNIRQKRV